MSSKMALLPRAPNPAPPPNLRRSPALHQHRPPHRGAAAHDHRRPMNPRKSLYARLKEFAAAFRRRTLSIITHTFTFAKKWLLWPAAVVVVAACVWSLIQHWDSLVNFWTWLRIAGNSTESGSTTVRNLGLVIAGLIALPLAIWRSMVAQKQAEVAQQGLLNERYQKGAEMLGSETVPVRLGGIYALQRLAEKYPSEYHIQTMLLLCTSVRYWITDNVYLRREDVQTAMDVIGYHNQSQIELEMEDDFTLDLRFAPLRGCFRSLGIDLYYAHYAQTLSQRSHRRTVGCSRSPAPTSQTWRTPSRSRPSGGGQRHPVRASERMRLAYAPQRSSSLANSVQILSEMDNGRNVETGQWDPALRRSRGGGQESDAQRGDHRQPVSEDY